MRAAGFPVITQDLTMAHTVSDLEGSALKPREKRWRDLLREPVASICLLFIAITTFGGGR